MPRAGLSLMLTDDFLQASMPLFEREKVDVLEWSFDVGWSADKPQWLAPLLDTYSAADALIAHGVNLSPLSAHEDARQRLWMERAQAECERRKYLHLSEHFGFSCRGRIENGAPLPVPFSDAAVAVGQRCLSQLKRQCGVEAVGMENLALAFNREEALNHGKFLTRLLEKERGFVLLDLHNLFCQMKNFQIGADELLSCYPVESVRELHLSGGSWSAFAGTEVRRDTHDDDVPEELFLMLERALQLFPNVEYVILERLGGTLKTSRDQARFREQFLEIARIVDSVKHEPANSNCGNVELAACTEPVVSITDDEAQLAVFQQTLVDLLCANMPSSQALQELQSITRTGPYGQYTHTIEPAMFDVAKQLMSKWGRLATNAVPQS